MEKLAGFVMAHPSRLKLVRFLSSRGEERLSRISKEIHVPARMILSIARELEEKRIIEMSQDDDPILRLTDLGREILEEIE